jgi:hypothetical protein
VLGSATHLACKAEALHLADRTSEALEAINEAVAIAERFEHGYCSAELHRLRGVFLATLGAEELQIETSFCKAIRIASNLVNYFCLARRPKVGHHSIPGLWLGALQTLDKLPHPG